MLTHCYWHLACWLVPPRMPPGLSGRTHHWGLLVKLVFYCSRQDEHNRCVGSQLVPTPNTAQQYSRSYIGLASCLNDRGGTMFSWETTLQNLTPAFAGAATSTPSLTQAHRTPAVKQWTRASQRGTSLPAGESRQGQTLNVRSWSGHLMYPWSHLWWGIRINKAEYGLGTWCATVGCTVLLSTTSITCKGF